LRKKARLDVPTGKPVYKVWKLEGSGYEGLSGRRQKRWGRQKNVVAGKKEKGKKRGWGGRSHPKNSGGGTTKGRKRISGMKWADTLEKQRDEKILKEKGHRRKSNSNEKEQTMVGNKKDLGEKDKCLPTKGKDGGLYREANRWWKTVPI